MTLPTIANKRFAQLETGNQMNADANLTVFDSKSPVYAAVAEVIGDTRGAIANADILASKLAAIVAKCTEAANLPVATAGNGLVAVGDFTAESPLPEAGGRGFILSTVGKRGIVQPDGTKRDGIFGLAVYPAHDVESIMEHAMGPAYVQSLVDKEQGLVAFRDLRLSIDTDTIATMAAAADAMPITLDDFLNRGRKTGGSPYAVFNDNWTAFVTLLRDNPAIPKDFIKALPTKKDMLLGIRSAAYAAQHFPGMEDAKGGSLFVRLGTAFANAIDEAQSNAANQGVESDIEGDSNVIRAWIEDRDNVDLTQSVTKLNLGSVDLGAFGA